LLHSPLLFDALLLICPFSFGKRGHLRAHGAILTCVPVHFAEPHEHPSRKPAERGGFRFPAKSLAAGHLSMHTVSSYLRGQGNFEMLGGVFANIARLLLIPLGLVISGNLCYAVGPL
jgi:hypothetical protein